MKATLRLFLLRILQLTIRVLVENGRITSLLINLLTVLILFFSTTGYGQTINSSDPGCNEARPLVNSSLFSVSVVNGLMPDNNLSNVQRWTGAYGLNTGKILNADYVTDTNLNNPATMLYLLSVSGGQRLTVQNNNGIIPAGYFAGFEISNENIANISWLGALTVKTYLGNTLQEMVTGSNSALSVHLLNNNNRNRVGFITSKPFNRIMIDQRQGIGLSLGTTQIYYALIQKFCAGPTLDCNTDDRLSGPGFPVVVDARNSGVLGLACLQCSIANPGNAIDSVADNYAQAIIPAGVTTAVSFAVRDAITVYHTDTTRPVFAGFDIENPNLIGAEALSAITVATTLHGVIQETAGMSSGLISAKSSLLNGAGRQTVGFIPSGAFDGIKIIFSSAVKLNLGTTRIYHAVLKQFCRSPLACNILTPVQNPAYAVYVNGLRTGLDGLACAGCQMNNTNNIIDGTAVSPATLIMNASVGSRASVSVANPVETYPAESFAGFDIESASLLSGDLLANLNITLYNNGVPVQSGSGETLLAGANSSLINGGPGREIVGIIGHVPFDEIQLNILNLVGADLGIIKIYKPYIQKTCGLPVGCNFSRLLNSKEDGAVIDAAHSGIKGGVCAGCIVQRPWNAVSESIEDYARLYNTAGALVTNSLAVAIPAYTFPAGTFAGFTIRKNSFIVAAALFPNLTITTYNNGVRQESRTGASLIDLTVLLHWLGTPDALYTPGFYTSKPFDEIQITVGSLVTALDQYIDIYGAYVDARGYTAGTGLNCNILNPDINVTSVNVTVKGNLSTNDKTQSGTAYGAAVITAPGVSNPTSDSPTINADGSYTFTASIPGLYQFEIPVCPPGTSVNCQLVLLTITVLDNTPGKTNPPVANTDIATTAFNTATSIPSLSNDKPGSPGFDLVPSSVALPDLNGNATGNTSSGGTATVDPTTGNIMYRPPADFVGTDTIQYTVCDNQPVPECASAFQIVKVLPPGAVNTTQAADDYYSSASNTVSMTVSAANGLLKNDIDPEGDSVAAIPTDTVIAGVGRFQLAADGSFVFTPAAGFTGTLVMPYSVKDNGNPSASASATVYILIKPLVPDLKPVITVVPAEIHGTTKLSVRVDILEVNKVPTLGLITVYLVKNRLLTLSFDPSAISLNGVPVQNGQWTMDANSNASYYVLTTQTTILPGSDLSFGFNGVFTPGATNGKISITTIITPKSGSETNSANNIDAEPIAFYEN